jgi:hypothetical protein
VSLVVTPDPRALKYDNKIEKNVILHNEIKQKKRLIEKKKNNKAKHYSNE